MCPLSVGVVVRKNELLLCYLAGQLQLMNFGMDTIDDSHLCGKTKAQSSLHLSFEIMVEIAVLFLKEKQKKSINSLRCVYLDFYTSLCSFNFYHIMSLLFINNLTSLLMYYI